jgi:hypothetical protein
MVASAQRPTFHNERDDSCGVDGWDRRAAALLAALDNDPED